MSYESSNFFRYENDRSSSQKFSSIYFSMAVLIIGHNLRTSICKLRHRGELLKLAGSLVE